jgi:signal transduction histidine kinase
MSLPPLSLKWFIALAFLCLGLVLVIGYSVLSAQYFIRGMDNMIASNLQQTAQHFVQQISPAQRKPRQQYHGYSIALEWQQLPEPIKAVFELPLHTSNELYTHSDTLLGPPDLIQFLLKYEEQGETLYISHSISPKDAPTIVDRNAKRSLHTLLLISTICALALALTLWLLMRQVSRPVAHLGHWTQSLSPSTLAQPTPDFNYPELNNLAELIRSSLSSVQDSLEREHRFLRHTSHELRTPISTIRNNIELLRKLQQPRPQQPCAEQLAIDRIDRASLTMQHLTETLLWLKNSTEPLATQTVKLDQLVQQLVEELRYLLSEKQVDVELQLTPCDIDLPEIPARIVLGNLIRNAFQHTWDGRVLIRQQPHYVEIQNREAQNHSHNNNDLGFGLGLQLTEQLATRLNWLYQNTIEVDGRKVSLEFQSYTKDNRPR